MALGVWLHPSNAPDKCKGTILENTCGVNIRLW